MIDIAEIDYKTNLLVTYNEWTRIIPEKSLVWKVPVRIRVAYDKIIYQLIYINRLSHSKQVITPTSEDTGFEFRPRDQLLIYM
jgi:hypothetical protein